MAFDLKAWKVKLVEGLQGWRPRMERAGAHSVYYFLAATALWPVVEAVRGGDWSAASALGGLAAGVGTNLLANQLQGWKDGADAAEKLEKAVEEQDGLRAEVDAVLEKLEALQLAGQGLSQAERIWFTETLGRELGRVGSTLRMPVFIEGDYVARDKVGYAVQAETVGIANNGGTVNQYFQVADDGRAAARKEYLTGLRWRCQVLPLPALGGEEIGVSKISLDHVYTELDTTERKKIQPEEDQPETRLRGPGDANGVPVSALEAFQKTPRLVLLGDPGAGKSTFVQMLLAWQAGGLLGECKELPPGCTSELLPVLVRLRELSERLDSLEGDKLPEERRKLALVEALRAQAASCLRDAEKNPFAVEMSQALAEGRVLLALDGLDETPYRLRRGMRRLVEAVIQLYRPQRLLLTCRKRSYEGEAQLPDLAAYTLAPFDEPKIRKFCGLWYQVQQDAGRYDAKQAEELGDQLAEAALADDLREMAENPMLLTTMAIVHQKKRRLPHERVRLYSDAVEVLAFRWQRSKTDERTTASDELRTFLGQENRLRATLERLAYEAHKGGGKRDELANLGRLELIGILEEPGLLGSAGLAEQFLQYIDQRSGLLQGYGGELDRPERYGFPHRTFQEYLAGCYLMHQADYQRLLESHAREGEYWDLAVQLGFEEVYYNLRNVGQMLNRLAYAWSTVKPSEGLACQRLLLWSGNLSALVGVAEFEADHSLSQDGTAYLKQLRRKLVKVMGGKLPAVERAEAGRALAKLGDPRPEVMDVDSMRFCFVPGGPFQMGSDKERDSDAFDDELPLHEIELPAFWIGAYPVSNAQFDVFVQACGYEEQRYWNEARAGGWWKAGGFKGRFDEEWRRAPAPVGEPFNLPNHPAVGVSWYEALAFTRWLEERWKERGWIPADWQVDLPTEAEWEKSARGGRQIPLKPVPVAPDGLLSAGVPDLGDNPLPLRIYPWGDRFDPQRANTGETQIGSTSALGCFPGEAGPNGAQELSGNVWEWCRSRHEAYPYRVDDGREGLSGDVPRALRGGSYIDLRWHARCASRDRYSPDLRFYYVGFRLAVRLLCR
jgi:formylglycine-generating enzyme required for sulfatase activity